MRRVRPNPPVTNDPERARIRSGFNIVLNNPKETDRQAIGFDKDMYKLPNLNQKKRTNTGGGGSVIKSVVVP